MIELLPIHTCRKRTQMRTQENENLFIPCVDACVYICVGVAQQFLAFAFAFTFWSDWLAEGGVGTNPITLLEINSTFQSWPNTNITRTSNRVIAEVDVSAWNLRASRINGWKVRKMLEFDVFRQWVTVLLKKTMYNQFLRFFKVYLGTENWNEKKSRTYFCNSGEIKVQLAYTNTLLFHWYQETEFCCYRHWQSWQLVVIKIATMISAD